MSKEKKPPVKKGIIQKVTKPFMMLGNIAKGHVKALLTDITKTASANAKEIHGVDLKIVKPKLTKIMKDINDYNRSHKEGNKLSRSEVFAIFGSVKKEIMSFVKKPNYSVDDMFEGSLDETIDDLMDESLPEEGSIPGGTEAAIKHYVLNSNASYRVENNGIYGGANESSSINVLNVSGNTEYVNSLISAKASYEKSYLESFDVARESYMSNSGAMSVEVCDEEVLQVILSILFSCDNSLYTLKELLNRIGIEQFLDEVIYKFCDSPEIRQSVSNGIGIQTLKDMLSKFTEEDSDRTSNISPTHMHDEELPSAVPTDITGIITPNTIPANSSDAFINFADEGGDIPRCDLYGINSEGTIVDSKELHSSIIKCMISDIKYLLSVDNAILNTVSTFHRMCWSIDKLISSFGTDNTDSIIDSAFLFLKPLTKHYAMINPKEITTDDDDEREVIRVKEIESSINARTFMVVAMFHMNAMQHFTSELLPTLLSIHSRLMDTDKLAKEPV